RHTRFSRDWSSDVCSSDLRAARAQRFARGRAVAGEIEAAVAEYVVRTRVDALDTTHGLATIAFLVDRDTADRYRSALDRALASRSEERRGGTECGARWTQC